MIALEVLGSHRPLALLAHRIAYAWTPTLGAERAHEAARNAVTPIGLVDLTVAELATSVLEQRVRAFGWDLDAPTVALLAAQAELVATTHAAERPERS